MNKQTSQLGNSGFTLLEILMVVALLGLLMSVALPKLDRITRANVRTGVRRLGALVKLCYDQSVLTGKLHRISFDLADGKNVEAQSWKFEMAVGDTLPEEQLKDALGDNKSSSSSSSSDSSAPAVQPFVPAERAAKHFLPKGIKIVQIKSWRLGENKALTQGPIAVYCFPNGFVDDATVYLQEENKPKSTLFIVKTRSLTGRVDIEAEAPTP